MMNTAIEQFRENIYRIRNLEAAYAYLASNSELDMSDILRAEVVLIVSALDTFIHDIVRLGMLEILRNERRPQTKAYKNFSITMNQVSFDSNYAWFERTIRRKHNSLTFQNPLQIREAIEYISDKNIWELVAKQIQKNEQDIKHHLQTIVNQRNRIAHESDMNPAFPNTRYPIDVQQTKETIGFIEEIAEAIYIVLTS